MTTFPDPTSLLHPYQSLLGKEVIDQLMQIASTLKGKTIVHVNSTKEGGGVAEILHKHLPLLQELGLNAHWEVIQGSPEFFHVTKKVHNLLQGQQGPLLTHDDTSCYEDVVRQNVPALRSLLEEADFVIIHDPQPAALLSHFPRRKGKWVWRCHIDLSSPSRHTWHYLKPFITPYDASIFSLQDFVQPMEHPIHIIPPSIDPFSEKNIELPLDEILSTYEQYHIDTKRPSLLQVSRFDLFKDPIGVIKGYKMVKRFHPDLQLILAGGSATDDPEGQMVYDLVQKASQGDPDIHILLLPPTAHRTINALQRGSDIVVQKSLREGFGLTVTEALWKEKPVIGGNAGGIRLQIIPHHTGFLVNTPEGLAHRTRYLLQNPKIAQEQGQKGRRLVQDRFLITRHLRDYLTLLTSLLYPQKERIDLCHKR